MQGMVTLSMGVKIFRNNHLEIHWDQRVDPR